MNIIYQNVQVILAVDHTMPATMGPREFYDMAAQTISGPPPYFIVGRRHSGLQASLGCYAAHINSPCIWEKRKTGLVGEYHLIQLVCRPALVISAPLKHLLNVDSGKQRFPDGGSSMISGIIELTANSFVETGLSRC